MKGREDQLLEHLLTGGNDSAANELLDAFHSGYPIERLRLLLQSDGETALKAGAWIASELGEKVAPLVSDLSRLLNHPSRYVRFFTLDAILGCTMNEHGEVVARAVMLILDPDEAVRWKALHFLANATNNQLTIAVPHLDSQTVAAQLIWLLGSGGTQTDVQEIITRLNDPDPLTRMFAAAAAARLGPHNLAPLEHATACTDSEVSSFANEELEGFRSRQSQA
jgi:HEAT repeat protein